jgi:hypothetical protein
MSTVNVLTNYQMASDPNPSDPGYQRYGTVIFNTESPSNSGATLTISLQGYTLLYTVNVTIDGQNVLSQTFGPNQQGFPTPITLHAPVNLSAGTHVGRVDVEGFWVDSSGNSVGWGETINMSIDYSGGGGGGGGAPGSNSKVLVGVLALTGIALGALVVVAKKKK